VVFASTGTAKVTDSTEKAADYGRTRDPRGSIRSGLAYSSRVVTAAALIMALVFVAFTDTNDPTVKAIACTLAAGVFLDAFLVRLVLVPALLAIGGTVMWHSSRWLQRYVPDPDIEGARLPAITSRPGGPGTTPEDDAEADQEQVRRAVVPSVASVGPTPQVTARLLRAAGASVTGVVIAVTEADIDELSPRVTVARIGLGCPAGTGTSRRASARAWPWRPPRAPRSGWPTP
jgi:MMPL family